ncbi:hypothetical protein F3168_15410 [Polymorphobacter fuscus]|uniref:Glycosyltransferase RgtA/B/C/D-like domain-containing protein n=1 Tax=Sandarakinorhabdus fusca TaxID=1439888 RepID=A0A7C9KJY4_9SPHN|nr:hypothetical protein F9290_15410 [Polymorphobacter fuscus]MQT18640.1 hypothetical protein [Polymorphobacter fuscus]
MLPLPPVYAGLIYRALGVHAPAAELVLAGSAIALVMAGYALFYRAFGLMGMPRPWRIAALAALCLVPLNMQLEIETFRIWEGGLSVAVAALFLWGLLTLERRAEVGWGAIIAMALLAALLFFISPPLGLAGYLGALLLLIGRLPLRRWAGAAGIAVAALALLIAPWAWRNQQVMGEALPLRSNAGLELALGNHPAAAGPGDPRAVFKARLDEIHPFESDSAFAAMQAAGGEIAYARGLGTTAKDWITSHPADFARLCGRHLRDFFFPPAWLWNVYSGASRGTMVKVVINALLSAAALTGALVAGIAAWRRYRFAILMLVVPTLPYVIVQPVLRYRYIIYALSVFFAADLASRLQRRRGSAAADGVR